MKIRNRWVKDMDSVYKNVNDTINSVQSNFDIRRFYSAEGYKVLIDDIEHQVLIQSHSNPINDTKDDKKIHVPTNAIMSRGSYVKLIDYNEIWLVLSKVDKLLAYNSGQIFWCNENLKWIDDYGVTKEIPAVIKNRIINSTGIIENDNLIIGDGRYFVYVKNNNDTKLFNRDFRFIIDGKAFRATRCDRTTRKGICEMYLQEDTIHPLDDIENRIAYNDLSSYEIVLDSNNISLGIGESKEIKYKIYKDGKIDDKTEVLFQSSDNSIVTITDTGIINGIAEGMATITISLKNNPSIKSDVEVRVEQMATDNYSILISPNDTSIRYGSTITFTVEKYNKESIVDGSFEITLDSSTTASDKDYEFSTVDNTYTIRNVIDSFEYVSVRIKDLDGHLEDKIVSYELAGIFG